MRVWAWRSVHTAMGSGERSQNPTPSTALRAGFVAQSATRVGHPQDFDTQGTIRCRQTELEPSQAEML
jgi:hypothetical protein